MLVPLQIPTGWKIMWNTWSDQPPVIDDQENKLHNDSPNLLLMEQLYAQHTREISREKKDLICLDLGWHYDVPGYQNGSRKSGGYKLVAYRGTRDNVLRQKNRLNFTEAKIELESWLMEIALKGDLI